MAFGMANVMAMEFWHGNGIGFGKNWIGKEFIGMRGKKLEWERIHWISLDLEMEWQKMKEYLNWRWREWQPIGKK